MKAGERMTDDEMKKYKEKLLDQCKTYCHIDYDDGIDLLELMLDTAAEQMEELIPQFNMYKMTSRQKLIMFITVKDLYDNRDKYKEVRQLSNAASSMLLQEMHGGTK